ncbi:hypothetical protein MMO39_00020 [Acinetobacter modestus]|uniref:hypothetical protein n=1 Tax=Acinetobacter modestus TaxID=1776740 RepID=UPI001F4BC108|nr:hypothetical protein [Acinetobacter modestus]MCH7385686.1 hypothetical protein [Acinetobacter modestus]
MKKVLLIFIAIGVAGCQQSSFGELVARNHLKEANNKIEAFLRILNNHKAEKDDQENILCLQYPKIYKYEYLPAILRLTKLKKLNAKNKEQLLDDLKETMDSYSKKLEIVCE